MVGQGEAVHAVERGGIDEFRDPPEPVEQAELGVDVEVGEVVGSEGRHGRSMVARRPVPGSQRPRTVASRLHSDSIARPQSGAPHPWLLGSVAPLQYYEVALEPALTGPLLGWTLAAIGAAST